MDTIRPIGAVGATTRSRRVATPGDRRQQMATGGHCICPKCGRRIVHRDGVPCRDERCSACQARMLREGSQYHALG